MNGRPRFERLEYTGHAIAQMFARRIGAVEVEEVANHGEVIADYPNDRPYPSCLLLGFPGGRPVHVVLAVDTVTRAGYIVTTYEPDPAIWDAAFRQRRIP